MTDPGEAQRLDVWLFNARFVKSRAIAGRLVAGGGVRINRQPTGKPHARLRQGDVLTLALPAGIRVVRVLLLGGRRGPAAEARRLFEEIPPEPPPAARRAETERAAG
jgi:ribosome-associated heat shock protein Hsp15